MKPKLLNLTQTALFAVAIALCSIISIPAAVPFTLQTFGVFFALFMLGGKYGTLSIAVYILLGAVGLPVFHSFTGGAGVLLSSTGGYIFGFLISGIIYLLLTHIHNSKKVVIIYAFIGLLVCYITGALWFSFTSATDKSFFAVLSACILPFIIPDTVKILLAYFLSERLKKIKQDAL